jgi:hypothetical protein
MSYPVCDWCGKQAVMSPGPSMVCEEHLAAVNGRFDYSGKGHEAVGAALDHLKFVGFNISGWLEPQVRAILDALYTEANSAGASDVMLNWRD